MEDYTNKRIDGRYEIQELIGVGGMACVYRAYDNIDDRIVAVKILKDEYLTNEDFRQRFKNESKVIAILSHPNIVRVYDVSYGDRLQYIVMEYVEGITLKEYIRQQGKLQPREVIHFAAQILRALQHAHDKGIVHRDVKPQNIMLLSNGTIKVTDFGIARFSTGITKSITESAIGSVHYISPEQARGEVTDDKADLYSVGIVLYEMLTGSLPFQSENSVSVAMMQIQSDPTPPTQINPEIPLGLEQMTLHAMRKNSKERYQSAAEMILDLEELRRNPAVTFDYGYSIDTAPTKYVTGKQKNNDNAAKYETKTANRTVPVLAGVGGAVLLAALVFVGIYAWIGFKYEVPDFRGKIYADEIQPNEQEKPYKYFTIVTEIGVSTVLEYNKPGQVYQQSENPKSKLKKGSVITLYVNPTENEELPKVKIPEDIIGMTLAAAESKLKELNLRFESFVVTAESDKDIGKVINCEPAPGTKVEETSTITLYYALKGEKAAVPNLVNESFPQTIDEAEVYLNAEGFELDRDNISYENSKIEKDRVIAQIPAAGTMHPVGGKVKVILSNGIAPESDLTMNITLPSRVGLTGDFNVYVNNELVSGSNRKLDLDGSKYSYTFTGSGKKQKVTAKINNWTAYSATVDFTTDPPTVTKLVTANPSDFPIYLPSVIGMSEGAGVSAIISAGFSSPTIKRKDVSDPSEHGLIIDQSPQSGANNDGASYFARKTSITLTVGRYVEPDTSETTTAVEPISSDITTESPAHTVNTPHDEQ